MKWISIIKCFWNAVQIVFNIFCFLLLKICVHANPIIFQGTFSVYERYTEIHDFVQENLEHSGLPFILNTPTGQKLNIEDDGNKTLIDLRLVPASVLTFAWHSSVAQQIQNSPNKDVYLKPEVMVLVQEV